MNTKVKLTAPSLAVLLWLALPVLSHGEEGHGASQKEHGHSASQEKHHHKAPHHGMVVTVGNYHYEMVADSQAMHLYLLDAKEKVLPIAGVTGQVVLQIPGRAAQTVALTPATDHFTAKVDLKGVEQFVAVFSLKIAGKTQSGRFAYQKKAQEEEEHGEEQHPEGHREGEHHEGEHDK